MEFIDSMAKRTPDEYNIFYALCFVAGLAFLFSGLLEAELDNQNKKIIHATLVVVFLTIPWYWTEMSRGCTYTDCAAHLVVAASLSFLGYRHVKNLSGAFNTPVDFSPYVVPLIHVVNFDDDENMLHKAMSMIPVLFAVMLMLYAINFMRQAYIWFVVICVVLTLAQLFYDFVVEISKK